MSFTSTPLVLANWKMNLSLKDSLSLARAVVRQYTSLHLKDRLELALAPTFPALPVVADVLKQTGIRLAAQDVFWKSAGPYTGEVSPAVLKELGVKYVIVGHSERRQYLKESDAMVQQKLLATLAQGLTPVLCVGETLPERQAHEQDRVVARQVTAAVKGVTLTPQIRLVVAYEPVWVIGSGQAVAPQEALRAAKVIEQSLRGIFSATQVAHQVHIIYGGSVDPTNITEFVGRGLLSGVLVGGASLEAKRFVALLKQL